MVELRQNLSLVTEAPQDVVRIESAPDQFDRDLLAVFAIGSDREIDSPESAATNLSNYFVGTEMPAPEMFLRRLAEQIGRYFERKLLAEGAGLRVGIEKRFYFAPERFVAAALPVEQRGSLVRRKIRRGVKQFLNPGVTFSGWRHSNLR